MSKAQQFETVLTELKAQPPMVGLAALNGKSPNKALQKAWSELNAIGVVLQKSNMTYRWRALHDINPKLGHAIEEVLVFGDALFSAWGQRQSPEGLKQEYIDLKQRFSKIIRETENVANPKEEKSMFSFFSKSTDAAKKTDTRLDQLDTLLQEAHAKSRRLLGKTEKDLVEERAFHKAAEWYVLAIEQAAQHLDEVLKKELVSSEVIGDLRNSLTVSSGTTSVILATTDQWLRVKEALHNKSITFLTAHENTFTVIQGHLRSWKDIKEQTEALNALNQAVRMGTELMSAASSGVEQPISNWSNSLISPETLSNLSASFTDYDNEVNALVMDLATPKEQVGVQFSRWDDWAQTKKDLIDPLLSQEVVHSPVAEKNLRPVRRDPSQAVPRADSSDPAASVSSSSEPLPSSDVSEQDPSSTSSAPATPRRTFAGNAPTSWNKMEAIVALRALKEYQTSLGSTMNMDFLVQKGWTAQEVLHRLSQPLRALPEVDIPSLHPVIRGQMDYLVQTDAYEQVDWKTLSEQQVFGFDDQAEAVKAFTSWMKSKDDLDWSYLMQYNELVYDLLILEEDQDQKQQVLQDEDMRASLKERVVEFLKAEDLPSSTLKEWGFSGLITRYALVLGVDRPTVEKGWALFHNPVQPIDWDGRPVSRWSEHYPEDMSESVQSFLSDRLDMSYSTVDLASGMETGPYESSNPVLSSSVAQKINHKRQKSEISPRPRRAKL